MLNPRFYTLLSMTLAAGLARLLPHWPNFTPIGAMALFGGAYFVSRRAAFAAPLAAMLISDAALGATRYGWTVLRLMPAVYACFAVTVLVGMLLRKRRTILSVAAAAVGVIHALFHGDKLRRLAGRDVLSLDHGRPHRMLHGGHSVFPEHTGRRPVLFGTAVQWV
jgi:hypothetical protein